MTTLDFSRPGKLADNAFVESFNGKVRAQRIDQNWFLSLDDARAKIEARRRNYDNLRPYGAIGNQAPMALVRSAMSRMSRAQSTQDIRSQTNLSTTTQSISGRRDL